MTLGGRHAPPGDEPPSFRARGRRAVTCGCPSGVERAELSLVPVAGPPPCSPRKHIFGAHSAIIREEPPQCPDCSWRQRVLGRQFLQHPM